MISKKKKIMQFAQASRLFPDLLKWPVEGGRGVLSFIYVYIYKEIKTKEGEDVDWLHQIKIFVLYTENSKRPWYAPTISRRTPGYITNDI